jgi:hypothetical protein
MKNKFANKTPMELTPEELLELTEQISYIEYSRRSDIRKLQDYRDGAQELLTYWYEKSARGKTGINEIKQKYNNMAHFTNLLHFESRNGINYNTDSLEQSVRLENSSESGKVLLDTIPDRTHIRQIEDSLDIDLILSRIDNTIKPDYIIKYNDKDLYKFSYRNLAKTYLDLFRGVKISNKDLDGVLIKSEDNTPLNKEEIKSIMHDFKNYIKNSNILGGAY